MAYRIVLGRDIKEQPKDLPGNIKAIARQQIAGLINNPRPARSKELVGHSGHYRLHLDPKHRLVWEIQEDEKTVEIEYVEPKPPDLYERLGLGRPKELDEAAQEDVPPSTDQ